MTNQPYKRLFLARHGETVANQQKLISGQLDTPLTEKGRYQAECLCDVLKQESLEVIYTSSLSRTIATAEPTAKFHGLAIQSSDALKEFHFGERQGQQHGQQDATQDSIRATTLDLPLTSISGESYAAFDQRISIYLETILRTLSGTALIVGHRHTNTLILTKLIGLSYNPDNIINIKNKYVYEINLNNIQLGATSTIYTIRLGGEYHGKRFVGLKYD